MQDTTLHPWSADLPRRLRCADDDHAYYFSHNQPIDDDDDGALINSHNHQPRILCNDYEHNCCALHPGSAGVFGRL
ncbi:hypothetical protein Rhopal_005645-T1 [Rhodotorula paludigena]|uniref:Uncharacterized protein n=1 Tax=Rhodotorula paludigena TaxID=86838 RepID=A0AAV5GSY6_9BASI|nr:hypothetical protein Rhopal_005645-T1 [Rhodotorula paludigena]